MITLIENMPENIVGFAYAGQVTATDYESVLFPAIENAAKKSKRLKILCRVENDFSGLSLGALKDDFQLGFGYFKDWEKIAILSDKDWLNHLTKAIGFIVPAKVKVFGSSKMDEAVKWLSE
ncbi:MAG TPA: STAS/SEC14 domain-containing protein [Chitinophagaceae bacterium]